MLGMLVAYDAEGNVLATLDYLVVHDVAGNVGLVDFETHEAAGGEATDWWHVPGATGSKVWPEWLGPEATLYVVERVGPPGAKRLSALVHRETGERRERAAIDDAIAAEIARAREAGEDADLRAIVGGPDRPLRR